MKVCLTTLCLNEMEWLQHLYNQHRNWPDLAKWIFVESADKVYATTNPALVTTSGLSVDGTSEFLKDLATKDDRITYIPHGFSTNPDLALGKCESRQRYLDAMADIAPDFFIMLDADEFYTHAAQQAINDLLSGVAPDITGICFKYRNIWCPPILEKQLFGFEAVGGFWDMEHCHGWRWFQGLTYQHSHMHPQLPDGTLLSKSMLRAEHQKNPPQCIHMGFAANANMRQAKHNYYAARGEAATPSQHWYVASRAAYHTWYPGQALPHHGKVVLYDGEIPEALAHLANRSPDRQRRLITATPTKRGTRIVSRQIRK